ncbi:fructokinase [Jatrophihabitans endophyticus]|uniref:Fructokinase n=1 Tax=Jatrophihabitans endophyticus TaxID=1206085 RepID=A0A1M5I936_9ACTN|nr:carbohydrate kinase [Jatrophihabitans endophyticus]SHG24884.1 fructokinase [Jatrophihabitans endophyticus]
MADVTDGTIAVLGEALIDVVETGDDDPRLARPGGSPYNVAIGLARLERPVSFVGRLSHDPLGTILRRHAERSGVDLSLSVDAHETTTVALVELAAESDGSARYRFGVDGTADFRWTDAELAAVPTHGLAALHFGSLASWLPPGDDAVLRRVAALREQVLVSYDPNVRPHLQPNRTAARARIERALPLAHVVKTSDEDIAWLYPDADADEIARSWLELGPELVVVTRGGEGSVAHTADGEVRRPILPIEVADTVGAGDAFMSGLLDALCDRDLVRPGAAGAAGDDVLGAVLVHAALVAGITCSRAGANPPRRSELAAHRST